MGDILFTQRACNNRSRVQRAATVGARLSPPRLHSRTVGPTQPTSTTLSMYCSWRISVVKGPWESASAPRQGRRRAALWDLDCLHTDSNEECARPAKRDIDHRIHTPLGSLYGLPNRENHGNRPRHHVQVSKCVQHGQRKRSLCRCITVHLVHTGQMPNIWA